MSRTIDLRRPKQPEEKPQPVTEPIPSPVAAVAPAPVQSQPEKIKPRPVAPLEELFPLHGVSWTAALPHAPQSKRVLTIFVALLAALAAGVWFFQDNGLLALLLLLSAGAYIVLPKRRHTQIRATADHTGITINGAMYPYQHLHSFWVHDAPGGLKELSIKTNRWHLSPVRVPLGDQDPLAVRTFLAGYVLEQEHHASLIDTISHHLGF